MIYIFLMMIMPLVFFAAMYFSSNEKGIKSIAWMLIGLVAILGWTVSITMFFLPDFFES